MHLHILYLYFFHTHAPTLVRSIFVQSGPQQISLRLRWLNGQEALQNENETLNSNFHNRDKMLDIVTFVPANHTQCPANKTVIAIYKSP